MAVPRITKEELKQRLDGDEAGRPALADVRRKYAWDHSTLKLPGAIRLDPKAPDASALPKGRDLVVYCSDPNDVTSVDVAVALLASGVRAHVLQGGLPEWVGASLPTETKDAVRAVPPPAPPAPAAAPPAKAAPPPSPTAPAAAPPAKAAPPPAPPAPAAAPPAKAAPPAGEAAATAVPGPAAPKA